MADVTDRCPNRIRTLCKAFQLSTEAISVRRTSTGAIYIRFAGVEIAEASSYQNAFELAKVWLEKAADRRRNENPDGDALQRLINK